MADELKFGVSLEDNVSPAAVKASTSLKKLGSELVEAKGNLRAYQAQLSLANKLGDIEGHRKYGELVQKTQRSVFDLTNTISDSGGKIATQGKAFLKVVEPAEVARHALEQFGAGFRTMSQGIKSGQASEVISGLSDSLAGLASTLDLVYPGLGQVASAAIKAGGAFAAMTVGVIQAGVEMALEVGAVNEKLEATFQALGKTPQAGKETVDFLNKLSTKLPQSRDQLADWTKEFQSLGMTDLGQIRQQVEATASAQAIGGDRAAAAYIKLTEKVNLAVEAHKGLKLSEKTLTALYHAGLNTTDVAAKMGLTVQQLDAQLKAGTIDAQKFGNVLSNSLIEKGKGPLEAMGNELGVLKAKGMETLNHLFDGIDTKPITDAIKSVISLGDQGRPSGQALHMGIAEGISGVIRMVGKGITELEVIFLTLELYVIKSGITMKDVGAAAHVALMAIKAGAVVATLALAPLVIEAALLAAPFIAAFYAATKLYEYLDSKSGTIQAGGKKLGEMSMSSLGGPGATAPAHATGGMVQPARGEMFASVAPGEMILPKREAQMMGGNALGNVPAMFPGASAGSQGGSGGGVHIDRLEVNMHAAGGVTDAQQLSITGIMLGLERAQLASGR